MAKWILLFITLFPLVACSHTHGDHASAKASELTGLSRHEVENCLGKPVRDFHVRHKRFLGYLTKHCVVTFETHHGRVSEVMYTDKVGRRLKAEDCPLPQAQCLLDAKKS